MIMYAPSEVTGTESASAAIAVVVDIAGKTDLHCRHLAKKDVIFLKAIATEGVVAVAASRPELLMQGGKYISKTLCGFPGAVFHV